MVSMYEKETKTIKHMSVNACLAPVCAMHGLAVTTVEGIGSTKTKLHAIQERMSKMHASQCGFCTPGIVMSMYTLLRNTPKPCMADVEEYFKGNLCRCTGYRPILEAMKTFCIAETKERPNENEECDGGESSMVNKMNEFTIGFSENCEGTNGEIGNSLEKQSPNADIDHLKEAQLAAMENTKVQMNGFPDMQDNRNSCCGAGENCCKKSTAPDKCTGIKLKESLEVPDVTSLKFIPYDPSQEPIFPPSLLLSNGIKSESLLFQGERVTWYRPTTLNELLSLKEQFPYAKIVVGNTEVGLETKFKHLEYPVLIHPSHIKELKEISILENGVTFGASVTLVEMETVCRRMIEKLPAYKTRVFSAFVEMMQWFSGKQIRYVAAVGGNIMTGSPISDLVPIFMASKCRLDVACKNEQRSLEMNEKFYVGYRKTCLKTEEVLVSITLPFTETNEYFQAYKQAKRRDDDIAIVNAAFRMVVEGALVKDATFCYGGLAPTSKLALKTMELLQGKQLGDGTLEATLRAICSEFNLPPNAPGGMVRYRRSLAMSLFFKFFLHVAEEINVSTSGLLKHCSSATKKFHKGVIKSHQFFKLSDGEKKVVGKPIPHKSGDLHTTGEAVYVDDMAKTKGELELVFVTSTKPHAKILDIDPSEALLIDGVVDFVSHKDLSPERNLTGIPDFSNDEELFASKVVHCVGQVIGAVVATDKNIARRAANKVKVSYEELPAIVTIEQAIAANSYYGDLIELKRGNVQEEFDKCDHIIEGTMRTGAQEHFYFETQTCIAFPLNENEEIIIYSATQSPSDTQKVVSKALGVDYNRIVCKTKRLGGGFGGKETKASIIAAAVAVVACKIGKPVRIMLDRDEDMIMTGGRHPFLSKYKIGFNKDGHIIAANTDLYSNAGWSVDLSLAVLQRAVMNCENSYFIPCWRSSGRCCRTNLASNTAFRGFGAVQGMMMAETWINEIATFLERDPAEIREKNMYQGGELTHYKQVMEPGTRRCWDKCIEKSNYYKRRQEVEIFNDGSRWKKRGVAIVPVTYGIGIEVPHFNRGGALVHIYFDGSVLVSHGGVEMGQGLHTKMIQVASTVLEIPHNKIFISHTATDKVPNTIATSASHSSDLQGMAVMDACQKLMKRLEPYRQEEESWNDIVKKAYYDRVCLSATGYYKTPDIGYDIKTNIGRAYNYYTFGVGCSVVEIDCLTGDNKILSTEIVMDLGESLNPAIDIGQIEGAFMQGYGLFVLEQFQHSPNGVPLTVGPSTYKIPGFGDVPEEFNVSLLSGSPNVRALYSSRAVGEPPLFLSASAFFAIRDAIRYARKDAGYNGIFKLEAPATAERIRMACQDPLTEMVPEFEKGTFQPLFIQV
eukprot:gene16010-7346_t